MPDLEYSHKVHRQTLASIWKSGLWHEAKMKFLDKHLDLKCERCGRVGNIVPGHSSEDYLHMESYIPKVAENRVQALCPTCNRNEAKGKKPCPLCILKGKDNIWYISQYLERCPDCRTDAEKQVSEQKQVDFDVSVRKARDNDNARRRKFYKDVIKVKK